MTLEQLLARNTSRVEAIITAIDAGEDATELIERLGAVAPWEMASLGYASLGGSIQQMQEADEDVVTPA